MKRSLLIVLGIIFISISSCEYKYIDPIEVELPDEPISFSNQIETVFQKKCTTCHASQSPILTTGNAYNSLIDGGYINIDAPESSGLYEKVSNSHPGGNSNLSAEERAIILKWINEGAENN